MRPAREATTLEYALLGILDQAPSSGYELRRAFAETPLRHFSDSPGAIYPALRRLVARGWLVASAPSGGRRRREFRLGATGRAALVAWLSRPVSRAEVMADAGVWLRFAFMGQALPNAAIQEFLAGYAREMQAQLKGLRRHYDEHAATWPLTGRLAFEHGLAMHEGKVAWARAAMRTLKQAQAKT
ncbi:MAG: PadR family transcriptional regulator [Candidatus Krumholzibacteriia bacterium]